LRQPSSVFTHKTSRANLQLLHGICHSLLQGFTFLNFETYLLFYEGLAGVRAACWESPT
jgi:hypothetical protein